MEQQFNNMIQVLTYFADQCDMFKPMLEGVQQLQSQNTELKGQLEQSVIVQNRLQLETSFSADYANFGIATVNVTNDDSVSVNNQESYKPVSKENDLYDLIKSVINVGKDNYNKKDMEYKLDFYSMIEKIDFDKYSELIGLIESQHTEVEPPKDENTSTKEENKTPENDDSSNPIEDNKDTSATTPNEEKEETDTDKKDEQNSNTENAESSKESDNTVTINK